MTVRNGLSFSVSLYILIYLSDEFWSHTSPIFALFSPTPLFSLLFLLLANSLYLQEPLIGQNLEEKTKNFCLLMGKTQPWLPPAKERYCERADSSESQQAKRELAWEPVITRGSSREADAELRIESSICQSQKQARSATVTGGKSF